ncbi:hypothetical protein TYRP_011242 [Tyrophagus putrescentiae]|nr:hypothetical protein TYRP_011242 [Tyrophagus putrescentiae]
MDDIPEGDPEELPNAEVDVEEEEEGDEEEEEEDVQLFIDLRNDDALNALNAGWEDADDIDDFGLYHDAAPWVDQAAVAEAAARDAANRESIAEEIDLFNYDINLPLEHGYLGRLDHLHNGRIIFPDGAKLSLPLVYLSGVILVPGQEIPFTFRHRALRHFFERVVESETKTFGIGYDKFGTTAEVRNFSFVDGVANIFAEGRQRFRVTAKTQEQFEIFKATVVILPEVNLRPYFAPVQALAASGTGATALCGRRQLLAVNSLPELVHRQFDDQRLMAKLRPPCGRSSSTQRPATRRRRRRALHLPGGPGGLQLLRPQLHSLLRRGEEPAAAGRLRHHPPPPAERPAGGALCVAAGTGGTFVNPAGVVHELFTFSRVSNVQAVSEWSDAFSWFPNYGWIITRCRSCMLHLGWKFVTKDAAIHPKSFWAVTRTAIKLSFHDIAKENIAYDLVRQSAAAPLDTSHWNPNFQ